MSLFSFLFSKNKTIRSTHEAEMFREVFRENYELYTKVEKSDDLRHFRELEEYINSSQFQKRRKEVEQLSYVGSEFYNAERQYKQLLRSKKLQAYRLIQNSEELKGYLKVRESDIYRDYMKLKVVVMSVGFDKKLHVSEYTAYREIIKNPKIGALIRFEGNQKYKYYLETKDTNLPEEFGRLDAFIQSEEFKSKRTFLINKKRYQTTEDYKLLCEYEELKKRSDIQKYLALSQDPYFKSMLKWDEVFKDDFNAGKLDETRWIARYYAGDRFLNDTYGVGNDVQLYTRDNISFANNSVCLNFRKESIIGKYWSHSVGICERKYEYTSAILSSATFLRQKYGRFEAKIKLNRNELTQCFWLVCDSHVPHVNIMKCGTEGVGMGHIYTSRATVKSDQEVLKTVELANEYYIFTLEWTRDKMVWMVNDTIVKEIHENIPDEPMFFGFTLGANTVPNARCLPGKMEIDWVKVYKLKE